MWLRKLLEVRLSGSVFDQDLRAPLQEKLAKSGWKDGKNGKAKSPMETGLRISAKLTLGITKGCYSTASVLFLEV
jgi:hypothetical protein